MQPAWLVVAPARLARRRCLRQAASDQPCARVRPVIHSLWKEINAFYARGIAAMKAGESAKAYIYLSQYAMAVMHPVKGISRHPHYTEIDAGDRDKAKIIGKKVLERVERLQEEVKADFVRKVRTASALESSAIAAVCRT